MTYTVSDFDYELPYELIAQHPMKNRTQCRMMCLNRQKQEFKDDYFYNILNYLNKDDLLILNDTKVFPARLKAKRASGAEVEIFLLNPLGDDLWLCLTKNAKRVKMGEVLEIAPEFSAQMIEKKESKEEEVPQYVVKLDYSGDIYETLNKYGSIPLPPYINRETTKEDNDDYQTVFANHIGSVASPTAGLHFDKEILEKIKNKGVNIAYVTLNVGLGTFMPVKTEKIEEHTMHYESFSIPNETAELINNAKGAKIAVGTTVLRCLEATYQKYGKIIKTADKTNIFIYPPYKIKSIDKLITNFHLPKSTLIMLISAFAGKDFVFSAYNHAIKEKYRFFSYGDCMFIE